MWQLPHYQYFPFVFAVVGYLLYRRLRGGVQFPNRSGLALLLFSALVALAGWYSRSPWFSSASFVLYGSAFMASQRGGRRNSSLYLALPLAMLIRLPLALDQVLVLRLQAITSRFASLVLDACRVPHLSANNALTLPERELFVAEACSGIQSVFTLLFLACVVLVWNRRRLILAPLYGLAALGFAIGGNTLRVATIAIVSYYLEFDLASGWQHEFLGYLTLSLAVLMLISFDQITTSFFRGLPTSTPTLQSNPVVWLWNRVFNDGTLTDLSEGYIRSGERDSKRERVESIDSGHWGWAQNLSMRCYALVGLSLLSTSIWQATLVERVGGGGLFIEGLVLSKPDLGMTSSYLIGELGHGSRYRDGEAPQIGENADVWTYSLVGSAKSVDGQCVFTQTYDSWHELCLCYELRGWRVLSRRVESLSDDKNFRFPVANLSDMKRGTGILNAVALFGRADSEERGYLFYAGIDSNGNVLSPPVRPGRLRGRFDRMQVQETEGSEIAGETGRVAMVQLWLQANGPLDPSVSQAVLKDFQLIVRSFAEQVKVSVGGESL